MDRPPKAAGLRVVWGSYADIDSQPVRQHNLHRCATPSRVAAQYVVIPLVVPLLILFGLTWFQRTTDLDLAACRQFPMNEAPYFPYLNADPWLFLYRFGTIPGLVLGIGGAVIAALAYFSRRLRAYRQPCLFIAMLLALGPGLLVNGLLKPISDRPRPCELVEFGGVEQFIPMLSTDTDERERSKSFPSGHASMGFYLLAPAFWCMGATGVGRWRSCYSTTQK